MQAKPNQILFPAIITLGSILISYYYYFTDLPVFSELVEEDGVFENLTSLFLFLTAVFLILIFAKFQSNHKLNWKIGLAIMIVGLIFGAGEEISWGQRIFGVESSDFFKQNNAQGETNLHNMVVGGTKINKIIFSYAFSVIFGIYFIILPILYRRNDNIRRLVNQFGIPVATNFQSILFLVATVLVMLLDHSRKWELWEFIFAFTIFTIFVNPLNKREIQTGVKS
ncbi:hypothetical protein [Sphingobacterium lumbrici]|uniref:hypothetical protein n=1 Tax=Sphingobacterium lumbrici TaxID=2559600 RepID=UPI00112C5EA2|nr:hypothetical protein [Sphingobacterium lumbrici]